MDIANIDRTLSGLRIALTDAPGATFTKFARSARTSMTAELFRLDTADARAGFKVLGEHGVEVSALLDPEIESGTRSWLRRNTSVSMSNYGPLPYKQHGKAFVRDGKEALITTGAFSEPTDGGHRWDLAIRFGGAAARAVEGVTLATISHDEAAIRAAADHASRFGIVVNDPRAGVRYLSDTLYDMVENANERLVISTKIWDDPKIRKLVKAAKKSGVDVRFTDLRASGLHSNIVIADNRMYVGTGHLSERSLAWSTHRQAREIGIVTDRPDAVQGVLEMLDDVGGSTYGWKDFDHSSKVRQVMDDYDQALSRMPEDPSKKQRRELKELKKDAGKAEKVWRKLGDEVDAKRVADGLTFTSPIRNQRRG